MKGLNFPTCKKQGALFYTNPQIYKIHGFKCKHQLGLREKKKTKNKTKQNQTKIKKKFKV
jgi:hypothetical protein